MSNVALIDSSECIFYLLRLFNFCLLFFHLCCATIYDGEIKLYILVLRTITKLTSIFSIAFTAQSAVRLRDTSCKLAVIRIAQLCHSHETYVFMTVVSACAALNLSDLTSILDVLFAPASCVDTSLANVVCVFRVCLFLWTKCKRQFSVPFLFSY